jgi:hypothetical protein
MVQGRLENYGGEDGAGGRLDDGVSFKWGLYHDNFVITDQFSE